MKPLFYFILALAALFFAGCSKSHPTGGDKEAFSLTMKSLTPESEIAVLAKSVATNPEEIPVNFEMGIIKGSRDFPFMLSNNSTSDLTEIAVSSSNPKFQPSPKSIGSLGAPGTEVSSSVLVQVLARHGVSESGTGVNIPVIKAEEDTTTIVITGLFNDSAFEVSYTLRVEPAYVTVFGNVGTGVIDSIVGTNCDIYYWEDTQAVDTIRATQKIARDLDAYYTDCAINVEDGIPSSSLKSITELIPIVVP